MKYIFLGSSPDSARTINFMGRVEFTVGGEPVEVTDLEVLDKLRTHKFFKAVDDKVKDNVVDAEFTEDKAVTYQDMVKAIAAAGQHAASRSKPDVIAAYEAL